MRKIMKGTSSGIMQIGLLIQRCESWQEYKTVAEVLESIYTDWWEPTLSQKWDNEY